MYRRYVDAVGERTTGTSTRRLNDGPCVNMARRRGGGNYESVQIFRAGVALSVVVSRLLLSNKVLQTKTAFPTTPPMSPAGPAIPTESPSKASEALSETKKKQTKHQKQQNRHEKHQDQLRKKTRHQKQQNRHQKQQNRHQEQQKRHQKQ